MEIIERIKKLHALSERNSCTAEAAAAAEKIQELCFKYNLELSAVLGTADKEPHPYLKHEYVAKANRMSLGWQRVLWHGIVKTNFCYSFYTPNTTKFTVVGQRHNYEVIIYQFEYLVSEIQRLALEHCRNQGYVFGKHKADYIRSFCQGAASEIQRIMFDNARRREVQTEECKALVVVKGNELSKAVAEFFPWAAKRKGSKTAHFSGGSGSADGRAAAHNISLNRGIGGTSRTLIS